MEFFEPGLEERREAELDIKALRVFLKALELLGGPRRLIEYRNLTWLPSLMQASYAVILSTEALKTADEIAQFLGISKQTVQNILRADPEFIKHKLSGDEIASGAKVHTAGSLAKLAYQEIMAGRDEISLLIEFSSQAASSLGITWAVEVLTKIKGLKFPVNKEALTARLQGLKIKGTPVEELLNKISFPVDNPAHLLKQLKKALEE